MRVEGRQGSGTTPCSCPRAETVTFAEMAPHEKHEVSHRGRAFRALAQALSTRRQD